MPTLAKHMAMLSDGAGADDADLFHRAAAICRPAARDLGHFALAEEGVDEGRRASRRGHAFLKQARSRARPGEGKLHGCLDGIADAAPGENRLGFSFVLCAGGGKTRADRCWRSCSVRLLTAWRLAVHAGLSMKSSAASRAVPPG